MKDTLGRAIGELVDAIHAWHPNESGERIAVYAAAYEVRALAESAPRAANGLIEGVFVAAALEFAVVDPWYFEEKASDLFDEGHKLEAILISEVDEALRPEFQGIRSARYRGDFDRGHAVSRLTQIASDQSRTAVSRLRAIWALEELGAVEQCIEQSIDLVRSSFHQGNWDEAQDAAESLSGVLFPLTSKSLLAHQAIEGVEESGEDSAGANVIPFPG
jgi:hypothetical protein